jgi:hypothetical protein
MKTLKWRNNGNKVEAYVGNVLLYSIEWVSLYDAYFINSFIPRYADIPLWDRGIRGAVELAERLYLAYLADIQANNGAAPYGDEKAA